MWKYFQPVDIVFGNNIVDTIYDIISSYGYKKGLLITDQGFVQNGLAEKIKKDSKGLLVEIFSDINPNPDTDSVDACASILRDKKLDFSVALGGGSVIDCAKAASSVCKTNHSIVEYHTGKRKFGNDHLPLMAIPTAAGTGSEVTSFSVLTDNRLGVKEPITSNNFYLKVAIIDPTITVTMPQYVTASTGFDALSHALEGFWSKNHQPICDALAIHSARLVFENLPIAYEDGSNIKAREKMCEASLMAGMSFALPKTAGVHACSMPLTNIYHMPHGEACAFTLDAFTRINASAENGRLNIFSKNMGFKDANDMADRIFEMKKDMKLKITLKDAGIKEEDLEELTKLSQRSNMLINPVEMDFNSILNLYKNLR